MFLILEHDEYTKRAHEVRDEFFGCRFIGVTWNDKSQTLRGGCGSWCPLCALSLGKLEMSVVYICKQTRRMKRRIFKQVVYELLLNTYLLKKPFTVPIKF